MKFRHLAAIVVAPLLIATACSGDDDDAVSQADSTASADGTASSSDAATASSAGESSADTVEATSATNGPTVKIVASVPPTDHGWLGQIAAKAQEAADSHPDVEFRLLEAADADSQASQIQTVINEKPDALVVLPYDGSQLTPVAEAAMKAGIPVINVDRLFDSPDAARATILGDNYQIGVKAATYIAGRLNCAGNVVEIQGIAGISVTTDRSAGFKDTLDALCGDGIKIVAQQPADFQPDKGLQVMEAILQANPKIDAVYTHDDDMAEGVVAAIENAGRLPDWRRWLVHRLRPHREGRPVRRDLPLQPDDGRFRRQHGAPHRPGQGFLGPDRAGGSVDDRGSPDRGDPGQRRRSARPVLRLT